MALKAADKKIIDAFVDGTDVPEGSKSAFYASAGTLYGPAGSKLARRKYEWVTWIGTGGTQYQDDTYRYLKKTVPENKFFGHGSTTKKDFFLWSTARGKNFKLPTIDGEPLTEKEATVLASKFDPDRRIVVRPASYQPSDVTEPNGARISSKQRAMLAIMFEAWKDGRRATSFINADERSSVAGLVKAGLAEETSRGKYQGHTEVFAKLTPAGLEQVKHLVPNSKASMGFVVDAKTQDFLRPANRSDMLKSLQSPTGEFSEGGRRVLVRNGVAPKSYPKPPRPRQAPILIPERVRHGSGKTFPSLQSFVQSSVKSQTGAGDIRRMQAAHEEELYPWRSDLRPNGGMTYFDKKARFGVTNNPQGKLVAFGDGVDKNRLALRASDFRENKAGVWVGPKATVENFRDVVLDLFEVDVPTEGLKDAKAADWALERNSSTSEEDWGSEEILRGMVLGFWLQGWAAAMEEAGLKTPKNITEENAPEPPEELTDFAMSFANRLLDLNGGMDLFQLSKRVGVDASEREEFGYYLAMESLGHGVSWSDDHDDHGLKIPDTEVGFSLEDPDDEDSAQLDYAGVASK